ATRNRHRHPALRRSHRGRARAAHSPPRTAEPSLSPRTPRGPQVPMNEPLRVAWLGHQSGRAGDGLLTYSRETVAGLRARGVKVFFVHHGTLAAVTDDGLTLRSLTGSHRYIISSPRTKRSISDLLRRENVDLVHVSLSFSTLIDIEKYTPGASDFKQTLEAGALVGYLGRVDPEKNVDLLVRAFQDVDAPEDVKLVVVGSGSEKRRLDRRYGSARVVFTGQVIDEAERIAMLRAMD